MLVRLRMVNLKLKLNKCMFGGREVEMLGHVVKDKLEKTDARKIKAIADMPISRSKIELR